jgi:F0F1-type ATP synthase membrane subunit b/b'
MSFWPLLILQLIVFAALVLLLRHVMTHHLATATAHLQQLNADYTRRHEELSARLAAAEQQHRDQTARAKQEAEHLLAQARQEAESARAKMLEDARTESERIAQQGMRHQESLRQEMEQAMHARAVERACELIRGLLPQELAQALQSQWLDALLQEGLAQLPPLNGSEPPREAHVTSAVPLSEPQRTALRRRLAAQCGREIALQETVEPQLITGLRLTLGSLVLDGTLATKLERVARQAQSQDSRGGEAATRGFT